MRSLFSILILLVTTAVVHAATDTARIILNTPAGKIYGTIKFGLTNRGKTPVVLIIPGSGPTDRDGNSQGLINDQYLALADSLAQHGISTLRYDKRGIAASKAAAPAEKDLRFDMYIQDAEGLIRLLKKDRRFSKVFVLGHSEGSLVGMRAVQHIGVTGFISLAGASMPADSIIVKQLRDMERVPPELIDSSIALFAKLRNGEKIESSPKALDPVFRSSVRPYMASWMKYDPSVEIKKVSVPTIIIQGTTDIQIDTASAHILAQAKPDAELVMIKGMNHVLREAPLDRQTNFETYTLQFLPLKQELVDTIVRFVKSH